MAREGEERGDRGASGVPLSKPVAAGNSCRIQARCSKERTSALGGATAVADRREESGGREQESESDFAQRGGGVTSRAQLQPVDRQVISAHARLSSLAHHHYHSVCPSSLCSSTRPLTLPVYSWLKNGGFPNMRTPNAADPYRPDYGPVVAHSSGAHSFLCGMAARGYISLLASTA